MARSTGSTSLTVMKELSAKALAYFRQNMSSDEAMRRAREEVTADMDQLGPNQGNLHGELENIWETQREINPFYTRPSFLTDGTDLYARLRYNKACRKAMLQAYSENAMLDLVFHGTADEMFNEGELIKPVSRRRWLHYIVKKPADENDTAAINHNRTVVLATALCEGAITREQYVQKMTVLYSMQGKTADDAAAQAETDSKHPYTFLYDAMLAKFAEGEAMAEDIKRASDVILTSQDKYVRMVNSGNEQEADQMLLNAYRTVGCNMSVSAMYNVANALDDLREFGMQISADDKKKLVNNWEDISIPLNSCASSVAQAANPYYAIFDPLELERKHVHTFLNQPGQNANYSYLYDFVNDNTRSVEGAMLAEKQQMLRRYGLENHGGIRIDELECKTDPDILITTGDGRTLISYIEDVRLGDNGLYTATIRNDVPGRYMDAALISDVQTMREKLAALPKQKTRVRSALGTVRASLDALAGVTLGDKADDERMEELNGKLEAVQTAALMLGTALRESGEKRSVIKEFEKALNAFVADKFDIMETIRKHKETVHLVEEVEAREQEALKNDFKIPENERDLTPMQRYLKPIEEARARKAAEAAAKKKRLDAEKEASRAAEALREGEQLNSVITEAEAAVRDVNVDERMQQDVVVEMIKAFVEGNRTASHAYYKEGDHAQAKIYGEQAVAGDTVREMLEFERARVKGEKRLENLLKKGGLNSLTALVMQSKKFREYADRTNMGNPVQLDKIIRDPLTVAKRVSYDVMCNVQAAQKKAAEAAPKNGQPQFNNAQPQAAQAGVPAPKSLLG